MIVLVTGASGFIGGALVRRLERMPGIEVHGVARRPAAEIVPASCARYHRADLSRAFTLDVDPDVVVHAAALASPWGTRAAFERHNVEATRRVVAFCERRGRPRLVHLSSTSVFYVAGDQRGLDEAATIGPTFLNDYARTKAASELVVADYTGRAVLVRPRAVFGPGDTVLFPRILRAARLGRLPLLERDGPKVLGDLIGIDALVDYLVQLVLHPDPAPAYNLTNAEPIEIETLLLDVLARLGLPRPTRRVPVRRALQVAGALERLWRVAHLPGEPPATRFGIATLAWDKTFDVRRMLEDLGPPSVTLADGVDRFVAWQRAEWTPTPHRSAPGR